MRSILLPDGRLPDGRSAREQNAPIWKTQRSIVRSLVPVVDGDEFERLALADGSQSVALFGARWCSPAYRLADRLAEIADRHVFTALWVDIDELPLVARRYRVTAVPSLVLYRNGQMLAQRIGELTADDLEDWIAHAGAA